MRLAQRVALITGSSRGIGRATAEAMAREGARVAVNFSRSEDQARDVVETIRAAGGEAEAFRADVRREEDVAELVKAVTERFGSIDILVNNAGLTRDTLLLRMRQDAWDEVLTANLSSVYRVTRAVLRGMLRKNFGRILNVTSIVGLVGNPGQTNYAAAKAGIVGFTKALAREVGSRGITVNAVAPGYIDTEMTRGLDDEIKRRMLDQIVLGRLGKPEDVAEALLFLASDAASYITGQTLVVDGGMTMV